MDLKYLFRRYRIFGREHREMSGSWLKGLWTWFWNVSVDNTKYLYQGEINQIRYLSNTLHQQREYIEFLEAGRAGDNTHRPAKPSKGFGHWLRTGVWLALLPISFSVYWIRRMYRILRGRRYNLMVSEFTPTEDMSFGPAFEGTAGDVYLVPGNGKGLPRGLVILRYTLSVSRGLPEPALLIDPGIGFSSEYTIPLPYKNPEPQELIVELPPHTRHLAFRAAAGAAEFSLNNVSMREISVFQAARYLRAEYGYDLDQTLHALFVRKLPGVRRTLAHKRSYAEWYYKYIRLSGTDHKAIRNHIAAFPESPLLSLVIATDNRHPEFLELCFKSLDRQLYANWEVLICSREAPDARVTAILNHWERRDARFRIIINHGSARITRDAGDAVRAARGRAIAFLHPENLLAEHALYLYVCWLQKHPDARLLYTDNDHIDRYGRQFDPALKPDWNYDYFLGKNYLQHTCLYDADLLRHVFEGGVQEPFGQSRRLILACIERLEAGEIRHIPYILHHQRSDGAAAADEDIDVSRKALNAHLERTGQHAEAVLVKGGFRIQRHLPEQPPLVSMIVLTRDRVALLSHCIEGLLERTGYPNIEIIIVDNDSQEEATLEYLQAISADPRVQVLRRPVEFNFSALNNDAVEYAAGDYLGLINNDIAVIEPGWLEEMMGHLLRPEVGVVGAKLLYGNDTIQHAGVITGLGGVAGHAFRHMPRYHRGYEDRLILSQELSVVTAACLLTKKDVYKAVGGFDEITLRIAMNDVDYCLKVREQGLKVIWTPFAELYHLESASRAPDLDRDNIDRWTGEYNFMRAKWKQTLEYDPYYNPNLTIADEDFALAHPPRLVHPWARYR